MTRQCLGARIPDRETLQSKLLAWEKARNEANLRVRWQFSTADARIKLKHYIPNMMLLIQNSLSTSPVEELFTQKQKEHLLGVLIRKIGAEQPGVFHKVNKSTINLN
jgi:hypothetical protein